MQIISHFLAVHSILPLWTVSVYHNNRLQGELLEYCVGPGEHSAVNLPGVSRKK